MKYLNLKKVVRRFIMPFLVIIISFLSYNYNFLGAANPSWFQIHDLQSQQLVLDGILNCSETDSNYRCRLGYYTRPGVGDESSDPYKLLAINFYNRKYKSGEFKQYKSQYGLQAQLFGSLAKLGYRDINILHSLAAFSMSLTVGILFCLIRRDFSPYSALMFSLTLIISPWVVVFSRNLYWVPATWFLPLIISMHFARNFFCPGKTKAIIFLLLFLTFLIKLLCGYEYMTSIFVASLVPILYQGIKLKVSFRKFFTIFLSFFLVFSISFITAIGIHIKSTYNDIPSGIGSLAQRARIRTYDSTSSIFSLENSGLAVTVRYMTTFYDFLPWLPSIRDISILDNNEDIKILKNAYSKPSLKSLQDSVLKTSSYLKIALVSTIISSLSFLLFLGCLLRIWFKLDSPLRAIILISFAAPVSWFIVAKAHSYIHYQLNYVLWYLPFIPYSFVVLTESFINVKSRRLKGS
jgi:hypothetical protein